MHKMDLIVGSTGSGKTTAIASIVKEKKKDYKEIFVVNSHPAESVNSLKGVADNVKFFNSVDSLFNHTYVEKIKNYEDYLVIIDESRLVLDAKNADKIVSNFKKSILSFQYGQKIKEEKEVISDICKFFSLNKEKINFKVRVVTRTK